VRSKTPPASSNDCSALTAAAAQSDGEKNPSGGVWLEWKSYIVLQANGAKYVQQL